LQQIYIASYYRNGYSRFMQFIDDVLGHPAKEIIEKRIEIIKFFDDYGAEATKRAFGRSRSTIFLWKQKLNSKGGKLSALAPGNKMPFHKRHRVVHPFIVDFIIKYRSDHPGVDKLTIAPILADACKQSGIKPISASTVGRIIHDLKTKGRLPKRGKLTYNAACDKQWLRERKIRKKLRRKDFYPQQPGDLVQMDTISVFTDGMKRYICTALDIRTRFAFAYTYKTHSSAHAGDFLDKFLEVVPFTVKRVQTDNGSEFAGHFENACLAKGLIHYFNYPRYPQANGHLERFNRTIQEQFVYWHTDLLDEPSEFNQKLMEYLIWYNTEKPHRSIANLPPLRYYIDSYLPLSHKSNMLWSLTVSCTSQ
jgi:putative transposase